MKINNIQNWVNEGATKDTKGDKEAYQKFFNSVLKKYGVKSPSELPADKKDDFFDEVDKGWKGDNEVSESNYKDFFAKTIKEYGGSIADMGEEKTKKFFNYIKDNWKPDTKVDEANYTSTYKAFLKQAKYDGIDNIDDLEYLAQDFDGLTGGDFEGVRSALKISRF